MIDTSLLHPMIIHFPIALIIVACFSEIVAILKSDFFRSAALYLFVLGALGAIAAYITGSIAGDKIEGITSLKAALERHDDAATLALWVIIIVGLFRSFMAYRRWVEGKLRWLAVGLALIAVLAIARTGYYGGELVFRLGAGVKIELGSQLPDNRAASYCLAIEK